MPNKGVGRLAGCARISFTVLMVCLLVVPGGSAAEERQLKGFSVVEKVVSTRAEPVYQVDGYQVQIVAGTEREFKDKINSLADVHPGTWLRFSGKRDSGGIVVAERATFYPEKSEVNNPSRSQAQAVAPDIESLIDSEGNFKALHSKVRLSDAGGWCGWHRIPPDGEQQARVRRVGNRLLSPYLKEMEGDQLLPQFRFFVVEEKAIRSEFTCSLGLVLVPAVVLDRMNSDDQLAAILADGIAYNIQSLRAKLIARDGWLTAAQVAEFATWAVNPIAGVAANSAVGLAAHEHNVEMELERGRLALSMMVDAGFDPHQAPEAWRLMGPKHLPKDLSSLKYPRIGQYQLMILDAQYRDRPSPVEQQAGAASGKRAK